MAGKPGEVSLKKAQESTGKQSEAGRDTGGSGQRSPWVRGSSAKGPMCERRLGGHAKASFVLRLTFKKEQKEEGVATPKVWRRMLL